MTPATLRLGTRASPLALVQARAVKAALIAAHGWDDDAIMLLPVTTLGDQVTDRPLSEIGGKALWTKPLDIALAEGNIDLAVHSMKDVETVRPPSLLLAAMLERADPRDRIIGSASIDALANGARVGTSSPRRAAQLQNIRPDLRIVPFRGNVATRLDRLARGEADATLLAAAGLDRLGHEDLGAAIDPEIMIPAASQGAIGIEVRADDTRLIDWLAAIDHHPTQQALHAERALLAALDADCHAPVGAHAAWVDDVLTLTAEILTKDGHERMRGSCVVDSADAAAGLAAHLLDRAGPRLRAQFGR